MLVILSGLITGGAHAQVTRSADLKANRSFVYHGKILRPDQSAPTGSMAVTFKIFSPDPSLCLLWSETQTINVKDGGFSAEIGHAVHRTSGANGGGAADFNQVFINNPSLTIASACAQGTSYQPTTSDDRLLSATFVDNGSVVEIAGLPIKSVPFALQAEQIAGFGLANLMKVDGASNVTYSPAEVQTLKDMLGGDIFFDMKSRRLKNVANPADPQDSATKAYVDGAIAGIGTSIGTGTADATKYLRGDGTWQTLPSGADNLGNHTATMNLNLGAHKLVGGGGTAGLTILNDGKVGISNTSPSVSLDVTGTINASAITIGGVPVTAGSGDNLGNGVAGSNITLGTNFISRTGTNAGLSFGATNDATFSGTVTATSFTGTVASSNLSGAIPSGLLPSLAGDVSGTIGASTVDKIKGVAVSTAPTINGQVLRYQGGSLTPAFISMQDLRSNTTGSTALATSCAASQTLTYNSVGDNLSCTNIAITSAQVSGLTNGTVTNVSGAGVISVANQTSTPVISISQASNSGAGYLSQADWQAFNSKQPAGAYLTAVPDGSVTSAKLVDKNVTFAKIQDISTNKILGRSTAGAGLVEEITVGSGLSLSGGTISATSGADNLGNHTAAANIQLGTNYLSRGTANGGLSLDASNNATFSGTVTATSFSGTVASSNLSGAIPAGLLPPLGGLADNSSVDLSGSEATGILAAGRFPALTGAITTAAGSLATSLATNAVQTANITDANVTTAKIADSAVTDAKITAVAWSKISGKPTTLSGYGITDSLVLNGGQAGAVTVGSSNSTLALRANGADRVSIDTSGNVGIGVAPTAKLDVAGAVKIGTTAAVCDATTNGAIRYTGTAMQVCVNGSGWLGFQHAAPVETDPSVGTLTNGKWCTTNGTTVNCTSDPPAGGSASCRLGVRYKSYSKSGCGTTYSGWTYSSYSTGNVLQAVGLTFGNNNSFCDTQIAIQCQ